MPRQASPSVVRSSVSGISETSNALVVERRDREADAGDGDRAVLDQVALEAVGNADPDPAREAVLARTERTSPTRVDVALDDVAAERLAGPQRRLEVDRGRRLASVAERRQAEGLVHHVGLERVGRRPRSRSGRRPRRRPSRPRAGRRRSAAAIRRRAPPSSRSTALDRPELLDDPGEHHHSRSRALASMSSPLRCHSTASGLDRVGDPLAARGRRRAAARRRARAARRRAAAGRPRPRRGASRRARRRPRRSSERDPAAAELGERAGEPALAVAGELDHLGARVPQRRDAGAARRPRRRATTSGASSIEPTSAESSGSRARGVEDDPGRLARRRGRRRRGRSAAGRRRARCRSRPRPRRPRRASGARAPGSRRPRSTASRRPRSR